MASPRTRSRAALAPLVLLACLYAACGGDEEAGGGPGTPAPPPGIASPLADSGITDVRSPDDGGADAAGPDAGDAAPPPCPLGAICSGAHNYAFVTSTERVLSTLGVAGADAHCNELAAAAGLPGTYVAWVSSTTSSARARLGTASGWLRTDRRVLALSAEELFEGRLLHPLSLDEAGAVRELDVAQTGTLGDGTVADPNCLDWTSSEATDRTLAGYPWMTSARWSQGALGQCNGAARFYCFGKDQDAPIAWTPVPGRRAFVTSASFPPAGGLAAADALCASEASAASLGGTFKALLATASASAISRFSVFGPTWVRVDGVPLWTSAAAAKAGAPIETPILLRADGSRGAAQWLWFGATALDAVGSNTCADWTSSDASSNGLTAQIDQGGSNFLQSQLACDAASTFDVKLPCFEE